MDKMNISKEFILSTIRDLKETLNERFKVKKIGLFGSYATDRQSTTSDIDFLVEFEENADLIHYIGLIRYLENIFDTNVDVVSKLSLKEGLREQILKEVLYE